MRALHALLCLACLTCLSALTTLAHAATVMELDAAGGAWHPAAGERITGRLPEGWTDNSGFCQSWVKYSQEDDGGQKYWSMTVTRSENAVGQVTHPLPDITEPGIWRIRATLRSPTRSQFSLNLRIAPVPYTFLWGEHPTLGPAWSDWTYTVRIDRQKQPVGFYCIFEGLGTVDIARLVCERLTDAELAAENPPVDAGGPLNRLLITRAPLGLPVGWCLSGNQSDGDVVQVSNDEQVVGVGGVPALKLSAPVGGRVFAGCFTAPSGVPHVASIRVRGTGKVWLDVQGDGKKIGWAEGKLSDTWQVVQVPFDPPLLTSLYNLVIAWEGTVWIDCLQVERGKTATDYQPPAPCEVFLKHDSLARVQFEAPVELTWRIAGAWSGATLVTEAADAYGRRVDLPPLTLSAATGRLTCPALTDLPFGPLRIQAKVVKDGATISPVSEIVVYRLPKPRHWGEDAPDSPFGVHINSTTRSALMAKAIGANWIRGHDAGAFTYWAKLEPQRGAWDFRQADIDLKRYRAQHLKVLGMLETAPGWANYLGENKPGYFNMYYEPKDLDAWSTYVRTVTSHFHADVDAWEVWNEPWHRNFWHVSGSEQERFKQSPTRAANYVGIQKLAYAAAKAVDPALTIIGSLTGPGDWTTSVRDAGGIATCDGVAYHCYEGSPGAMLEDPESRAVDGSINPFIGADGKRPKPLWMTEGSSLINCNGHGLYQVTVPNSRPEEVLVTGDRCARYLVSTLARDVRKLFIYSMATDYFRPWSDWKAMVDGDGFLHPSACAYAACAWQLDDTRAASMANLVDGVTAFAFQGKDRAVVVLAPQAAHAAFKLPAGITAADVFGNPLPAGSALGTTLVYLSAIGTAEELVKRLH